MFVASASVFLLLLSGVLGIRPDIMGRRPGPRDNYPRSEVGSPGRAGLCRFGGSRFGCCYGWKRDSFGRCAPVCTKACEHGQCTGPNSCKCDNGWTGSHCERDLNECSTRPCSHRCMNTPGSFRCYCEHGYILLTDGISCSRDDRCSDTRCSFGCIQLEDGFRCFCPEGLTLRTDGLGCTDIDECAEGIAKCGANRRCKNTYGNFMCLCEVGYKFAYVDGELACVDENECDSNLCDRNAYCINVVGGYDCKCNEGYAGDGKRCVPIDERTCLDEPCYAGVTCTDVVVTADAVEGTTTSVKQYRCGQCPPSLSGDGETCNLDSVAIQILTVMRDDESRPVGDVVVKVLQDQDDGQTEVIAEGTSNLNGIATLQVPSGVPLEIFASKADFVDVIKTYRVQPQGANVVTVPMESFPEHTSFLYRAASSKAFEFGNVEEEAAGFRLSFPEGALRARDGSIINIMYKGVDVSNPEALSALPDLTQIETEGDEEGQRLVPLGAAELTIKNKMDNNVVFRKPASISFLLKNYVSLLGIRDSLDAYYFDVGKGKWVKDGTGAISDSDDGKLWSYEANHFTWWMAATTYVPDESITVRTCFDRACTRPANHVPIKIYGENFPHYAEYETGVSGSICTNVFRDGLDQIIVEQNCTGDKELVAAKMQSGSVCSAEGQGSQVVTFIVPEASGSNSCPDPGEPDNGLRFGNEFNLGSEVSFHCDAEYRIEGTSQRVCKQCGKWSGSHPECSDQFVASGSSILP